MTTTNPTSGNMDLWNSVCETDPETTRRVNQRGGFTAICAQAQIKKATEVLGPCGKGWGLKNTQIEYNYEGETLLFVAMKAVFFWTGGEFDITSDIPYRVTSHGKLVPNEDILKKLQTDVTTKALSKLGFNSDVFEGKFEDNKYVESLRTKKAEASKNDPNRELTLDEKKALKAWVVNFRSQVAWTVPYEDFMTAVCRDSVGQDRPTTIAGVVKVRTNIDDMRYDLNTGERVDA